MAQEATASVQNKRLKSIVKKLAESEWKFISFLMDRISMLILLVVFLVSLGLLLAHVPYDYQVAEFLKKIYLLDSAKIQKIIDMYKNPADGSEPLLESDFEL